MVDSQEDEFLAALSRRGAGWDLAGYLIEKRLGRGGMGAVYKARHPRTGATCALKIVLRDGPGAAARFRREAQSMASIRSEHVVKINDFHSNGGFHFIEMEYVEGCSAEDYLNQATGQGRVLGARDALAIAQAATRGLVTAHRIGIIHRDIKPANLLIPIDPITNRLNLAATKVSDLGLAKILSSGPSADPLTGTMIPLGTPGFMPTEQYDAKNVGPQADVFAVGATLYVLLSGSPPFYANSLSQILARTITGDCRRITVLRPDVPEALGALIHRCLEVQATRRYADATALLNAFETLSLAPSVRAPPPVEIVRTTPPPIGPPQGPSVRTPPPVQPPASDLGPQRSPWTAAIALACALLWVVFKAPAPPVEQRARVLAVAAPSAMPASPSRDWVGNQLAALRTARPDVRSSTADAYSRHAAAAPPAQRAPALLLAAAASELSGKTPEARRAYGDLAVLSGGQDPYSATASLGVQRVELSSASASVRESNWQRVRKDAPREGFFPVAGRFQWTNSGMAAASVLAELRASNWSNKLLARVRDRSPFAPENHYWFTLLALVFFLRLVTLPLHAATGRSAGMIRRIQPDIALLRSRFSGDFTGYNAALQKLYAQHGITMGAGCVTSVVEFFLLVLAIWFISGFSPQFQLDGSRLFWMSDVTAFNAGGAGVLLALLVVTMFKNLSESPAPAQMLAATLLLVAAIFGIAWFWAWPIYALLLTALLGVSSAAARLYFTPA